MIIIVHFYFYIPKPLPENYRSKEREKIITNNMLKKSNSHAYQLNWFMESFNTFYNITI